MSEIRLLPWTGHEGKPCYLVTDGSGQMSRIADTVERVQLGMAHDLLGHASDLLDDDRSTPAQLCFLLARMSEALTAVLRIAQSRGAPVPAPVHDDAAAAESDGL
ncbi:hypothetical protein A6P39_020065 [Streptomyces sp. FXJ1.172]|uniref:hypothetical protein n=1 Tax=Streptomyces sp. FXJ1.172 TaxID=710705 RepID=UPI0007CFBAA9|nr:hypothetical protein [Streptomyces sp. FXJ1.172]WEO96145.1 hypothetical protein A6P39_020065 [Streptomyces sp. FXJ1.172]